MNKKIGRIENSLLTRIDNSFHNSALYGFFVNYADEERKFSKGFLYKFLYSEKARAFDKKCKNAIAGSIEKSVIATFFRSIYDAFLSCQVRSLAIMLLYFGIYSCALTVIKYSLGKSSGLFGSHLYFSVLAIILALEFISCKLSLRTFVSESSILSPYLIKAFEYDKEYTGYVPTNGVMIVLGSTLGLLTYFIPIKILFLTVCAGIFTVIAFKSPEKALVPYIIILPLLNDNALVFLSAVVLIAYIFKVIRGKRNFRLDLAGCLMILFGVILAAGSKNASGSRVGTELYFAAIAVFFIMSNCVRSFRMIMTYLNAFSVCSLITSVLFLANRLSEISSLKIGSFDLGFLFSILGNRYIESSLVRAEFLLILLPLSCAAYFRAKSDRNILSFISCILCFVSICSTFSKGLILAAVVCLAIYFIASFRHQLTSFVTIAIICSALLIFVLYSANLNNPFFNINDYRESVIDTSYEITENYAVSGIGLGKENFAEVFGAFSHYGDYPAKECGNMYLEIFVQFGLTGSLYIIGMILYGLKMVFSTLSFSRKNNNALFKAFSSSVLGVLSAVMVRSFTSDILLDCGILIVVLCLFGICDAMTRYVLGADEEAITEGMYLQ